MGHTETTASAATGRPRATMAEGLVLVAAAALLWSLGGAISRFLEVTDIWAVVFWRNLFATLAILAFLMIRDGVGQTARAFIGMGLPGLAVALCFSTATISFIIALAHTTVANILLIQAAVPLVAAVLSWVFLKERVHAATWVAIILVIAGVGIMVSGTLTANVSPIGDGMAVLIALAFSTAMVLTRRFAHVPLVPATALGTAIGTVIGAMQMQSYVVSPIDLAWLFAFGALTLGAGLALFTLGAGAVPASLTALVSVLETVLGPFWVWLIHGETPSVRTLIGGGVILAALLGHLAWQVVQRQSPSANAASRTR